VENKKFEQKDENESIFAVSFAVGDHSCKKMPIEYKIVGCVVPGNCMMLFYQCNVDVEFETGEYFVTGNELQRKKVKQCSEGIICEVTTLINENKYQLNKINSSLNYIL
jgi:hypothetical protein